MLLKSQLSVNISLCTFRTFRRKKRRKMKRMQVQICNSKFKKNPSSNIIFCTMRYPNVNHGSIVAPIIHSTSCIQHPSIVIVHADAVISCVTRGISTSATTTSPAAAAAVRRICFCFRNV